MKCKYCKKNDHESEKHLSYEVLKEITKLVKKKNIANYIIDA